MTEDPPPPRQAHLCRSTHIVKVPGPFCFGDGSSTLCPCGNAGVAGHGCGNSVNADGALLVTSGTASVANDTLVISANGMPDGSALFFQGTQAIAGGAGIVFGDGLRCAGGVIRRLGVTINVGGSSSYPSASSQPISVKGDVGPGDVRYYQCWYRNPEEYCTNATFNLTNAYQITWTP